MSYAMKVVGHAVFIKSYLGHMSKEVERHWAKALLNLVQSIVRQ